MSVRLRRGIAVLVMLCVLISCTGLTGFAAFVDTEGHWGAAAAERWQSEGILLGDGDGLFRPDAPMLRAEIAATLARLLRLPECEAGEYPDVPTDAWYAGAITKCARAGILLGDDGRMRPLDRMTREEAAALFGRALGIPENAGAQAGFSDDGEISQWAMGYVSALAKEGILNGYDGKFDPKAPVSRAAVATILDNAVSLYISAPGSYQAPEAGRVLIACGGVTLSGRTAADILIAQGAEGAEVRLSELRTAGNVSVTGERVTLTLQKSGAEQILLLPGASGTSVAVGAGSAVERICCEAPRAEIRGNGTVRTVDVFASDARIDTKGTTVTVAKGVDGTVAAGVKVPGGKSFVTPKDGEEGGLPPEEPESPEQEIPVEVTFAPKEQTPFEGGEDGLVRVPARELAFGYYLEEREMAEEGVFAFAGPVSLQKLEVSGTGDYTTYLSFREGDVTSVRVERIEESGVELLWNSARDGGLIAREGMAYAKFDAPLAERAGTDWTLSGAVQRYRISLMDGERVLDTQEYEVDFSGVTLEEMPLVSALWWTKSAQTSRTPSEFSFIDNARLRNQGANWLSISHRPTNREGKSVGTCWNTPPMMIEKELELAAAGLEDAHDNGFLVIGKTDTMQFHPLVLQRLKEEVDLWKSDPEHYTQEGRTCKEGEEQIFYPELFDPRYYSDEAYEMLDPELYYGKKADGSNIPNNGWQKGNYMSCLLNPHWQKWEKYITAAYARAGYDGVFADLFPYIQGEGVLCSCDYCKEAWRVYSTERFGEAKPFPERAINPETTEGREFFQFRLEKLSDFIKLLQNEGRKYNPNFVVLLNTNIDNPCVAYCIQEGMAQPISELGQFDAKLGTHLSGMYLYRAGEAMTGESVLSQYNNTNNLTGEQYQTSLVEAFASGGGLMLAAKNDKLQQTNIDFTTYLREYNEIYAGTSPAAEFAVLYSWRDHTFLQYSDAVKVTDKMGWDKNAARRASSALAEEGVPFDYLLVEGEQFAEQLSRYRVIVSPELSLLEDADADALRAYAEAGGNLLIIGEIGTKRIADNGLDYEGRLENLIETWTGKLPAEDGTLAVELPGGGRVAVCKKAVSGPQDAVEVEEDFLRAAEYVGLNDQVSVWSEDEAGNGKIETSLRAGAGEKLYLHLIRFGYGTDGLSERRAAEAELRLPEGKTAANVRMICMDGAEAGLRWEVQNGVLTARMDDLGLYAVLEVTLEEQPEPEPEPELPDAKEFTVGSLWWTNSWDSPLIDPDSQERGWWDNEVISEELKSNFASVYFAINTFTDPELFQDIDEKIGYHVEHLDGRYWVRPAELCQYAIDITQSALDEAKAQGLCVIPSVNTYCYSESGYRAVYDGKRQVIEERRASGELTDEEADAALLQTEKYNPAGLPGKTPAGDIPEYGGMPVSCINNDNWIAIQREIVEMHAKAGYPGMYYDLYPYSSGAGLLCSCDYCKADWATYSSERFGAAKPFPTALDYTSEDPETSAVSLVFYEFRREALQRFIDEMERAGRTVSPEFEIYLNSSIDNMSHQAALLDGLYQPTSELHQLTTGDMSGLYMFRMAEALSDRQLLAHYNATKSQVQNGFYQIYTILSEAYAGGGGYLYLASNEQQRADYAAFSDFLYGNLDAYMDSEAVSDTAILYSWENHNYMQPGLNETKTAYSTWGQNDARRAAELLAQNGIPYDYLSVERSGENLAGNLGRYVTVVVPELALLDPEVESALRQYAESGGTLLVLGEFGSYRPVSFEGNRAYQKSAEDPIDSWTGTQTDKTYSVNPVGAGRVIRVENYATNSGSAVNIRASAQLRQAFDEADIFGLLRISEDLPGHVESTLRTDGMGNYYLNLINFGTGANEKVEDRPYHVSLRLPEELADGKFQVRAESAFNLPITKVVSPDMAAGDNYGYTPGSYRPELSQCRIIDGRLELHGNFGLYGLITLERTDKPLFEFGPDTPIEVDPGPDETAPLEVASAKITAPSGARAVRISFKDTHALVEPDGLQWTVLGKNENLSAGTEWNAFQSLINSGRPEFGGTGWQKFSWDAVFQPKGGESAIPALADGERLIVRVRRDGVREHPDAGDSVLVSDCYFAFDELTTGAVGYPYEDAIYVEHIQVRDGKFAVTLNDYADLAEGALLAAVERNGALGEFYPLPNLRPLRASDGADVPNKYDWVCDLPDGSLAPGERIVLRIEASKVNGVKIGEGAVEYVPSGLFMRGDVLFALVSLQEGSVAEEYVPVQPVLPLEVTGAKLRNDQRGVRITFGTDHVRVASGGMQWAVLPEGGALSEVVWNPFDALVGGWQADGGEAFGQYQWDGRIDLKTITLRTGEQLLVKISADSVNERVEGPDGIADGTRTLAADVIFRFDSTDGGTVGQPVS